MSLNNAIRRGSNPSSNGLPQPPLQSSKLPSDTSKLLDKENSRKLITSIDFDPSIFLEQQINTISIDSGDPEQKLYNLFDSLTNQLTIISNDIELEANILQDASDNMENILYDELDDHSIQLNSIHTAIDQVKLNFNNASDNAIKIGSRLQNSEKERLNIVKSLELLSYIKDFYNLPNDITDTILSLNAIKLKEKILPNTLKTKEWNDISKVLHDLKKITMDITSTDEILKITKVIGNISEVVENELLGQFEIILEQIMESNSNMIYGTTQYPNGSIHNMSMIMNNNNHFFDHSNSFVMVDELLLEKARHLTECLHLFNNGQSLQKRYIFSVIQKRIPNNVYNSANANGKAGGGGVLHRLNNVFNQNSDDEMSSAGASSDGSDSEEDGARPARRRNNNNNGQYDDDNILQKATQATQNTINLLVNGLNTSYHNNSNNGELQVGDQLSNLFSIIDKVCREQFEIIRKIFPANTIARVTRLLVQRIFGDPAFGIQTKVDSILCPPSPLPPLALSDYLDALLTVREKLSALHLLLIECSLDPSLIGMGSESESLRKSKNEGWILMKIKNNSKNGGEGKRRGDSGVGGSITGVGGDDVDSKVLGGGGGSGNSYVGSGTYTHEESEEKIRSDAEIKEFLEEQITQVLSGYMNDYFEKEIHYVRSQYVNTMRVLVEETTTNTKVNAGTLLTLPQIKAEKLKTILNINKTIGNKGFFNTIFNITIDALLRMESIGRDDNKRLYLYCKNLYQLLLSFLTDGVILPICKTCTTLLIKQASCKPNESSLPPNEFLTILIVILYVKNKLKLLFDDHFYKIMKITPNYITICKENRLKSFQTIVYVLKESLHAWTLCISLHIEKLFLTLQGKFDYSTSSSLSLSKNNLMKQDALAMLQRGLNGFNGESNHNSLPCTAACNSVCKALILISQAVRNVENELQQQQQQSSNGAGGNSSGGNNSLGLDFEEVFWKPLGQQFVGAIISNIRRYKITIDGARVLLKDLEEFHSLTGLMTCIETMDMIVCLIEICKVFTADAEDVVKIVVEDLRHLDVAIVLSLVQCRADFSPRTNGSWAKVLSTSFSNYKWETPLPWETKKPLTIVSFSETLADNTNARPLGPKTLRREATTLSALYLSELALNRQSSHLSLPGDGRVSIDQKNRVVSLDLSLLEENLSNTDLQKHIKAVELHEAKKSQISSSKVHSKFLPNRPGDEESNDNHMVLPASSKGGSQKRPSETGVIAASIQRPDLIGLRTDSGERTKSTSSIISGLSNGSANGDSRGSLSGPSNGKRKSITEAANGTNGGQQPRRSVTESPATATLSATMKGNATPSPNGVRPTGMLSKMSSFFTGKK